MASRPSQNRHDIASGLSAGGDLASGEKAARRSRGRDDVRVELEFGNLSTTPREVELLCYYLGAEIDKILQGKD